MTKNTVKHLRTSTDGDVSANAHLVLVADEARRGDQAGDTSLSNVAPIEESKRQSRTQTVYAREQVCEHVSVARSDPLTDRAE